MSFYKTFGLALVAAIAIVYGLVTAFGSREVTADHYSAVQKYVREGDLAPTAVAEAMEDGKISYNEYSQWRELIFSRRLNEYRTKEDNALQQNKKSLSDTLSDWRNR